jgi:hypothetical protein
MDSTDAADSTKPPQRLDYYPNGHPDLDEIEGQALARGAERGAARYLAKKAAEAAAKTDKSGLPKK